MSHHDSINANQDIFKKFETEYEGIISIVLSKGASFAKQTQSIPKFLQKYANFCIENSSASLVEVRFNILSNLRSLCIEVLKNYPPELDTENNSIRHFFHYEVNQDSEEITVDFPGLIKGLQSLKNTKDVTAIEDAQGFYYYTVLEHYIMIANNLAYTHLEQENFTMALTLILKTLECWRLMQYNSYYLRYQISTVLINLASLVEEDFKVEASQLLCNAAWHLENLETEIDNDAESAQIYEFISDRASHFMFLLRSKDDKQSLARNKFNFRKSFLMARLCMLYAYYADFLTSLGKKNEGELARKHAHILKKELDSKEENNGYGSTTPAASRKEQHSHNSRNARSGLHSSNSSRPTTALTATATTNFSNSSKVSKENIIFQKHLIISGKKFRVIIVSMNDIDCLEVIAYDKPSNVMAKIFIHFQEILEFAGRYKLETKNDDDMTKLFSKLTKNLYFKDNNLKISDIAFFPKLEDFKISTLL